MATVGEMHPNLVCTAGFEFHIDVGESGKALLDRVMRDRGLAVLLHTLALAIHRVTADRLTYGAAAGQFAIADGQVMTLDFAFGQQAHQCRVCGQVFCNQ